MVADSLLHDGQLVWRLPNPAHAAVSAAASAPRTSTRAGPDHRLWDDLGLEVDPTRYRDDIAGLAREIRLYMALEELATGVDWGLDPELLAARVCMADGPVVIPFWAQL